MRQIFFIFFAIILLSSNCLSATEDLTTFTEVDPSSKITLSTSTMSISSIETRENLSYVYKDYTSIDDFRIQHAARIDYAANYSGENVLFGLSDSVGGFKDWSYGIWMHYYKGTSNPVLYISYTGGGNTTLGSISTSTDYYFTFERYGTTFDVKAYSDSSRTTLVLSNQITVSDSALSYLYIFSNRDIDQTGKTITLSVEDLEILPSSTGQVIFTNFF